MILHTISTLSLAAALALPAPAAPQAQSPRLTTQGQSGMQQIQGFNIVLVLGENEASGEHGIGEVPQAARRALEDVREFLPYKHYRVLDTQWTSCCGGERVNLSGRLQGLYQPANARPATLQPRPYSFAIEARESAGKLQMFFRLSPEEGAIIDGKVMTRPVVDSNFSMEPGETVVVGTSRVGGDKALIALVTAARKTGGRRD